MLSESIHLCPSKILNHTSTIFSSFVFVFSRLLHSCLFLSITTDLLNSNYVSGLLLSKALLLIWILFSLRQWLFFLALSLSFFLPFSLPLTFSYALSLMHFIIHSFAIIHIISSTCSPNERLIIFCCWNLINYFSISHQIRSCGIM